MGEGSTAPGPACLDQALEWLRKHFNAEAAQDFLAIPAGRANADWLFLEDRIEVEGDLSLALRMRKLFRSRG